MSLDDFFFNINTQRCWNAEGDLEMQSTNLNKHTDLCLLFLRWGSRGEVVAAPIDEKFKKVSKRLGGGFLLDVGSRCSAEREVEEKLRLSRDFNTLAKKTPSYLMLVIKQNDDICHTAYPLDGFCRGEVDKIMDEVVETGITLQVRTPLKLVNEVELEALKKRGIEIEVQLVVQHRWAPYDEPEVGIHPLGNRYPFCSESADPDEKVEVRMTLPDQREIAFTADIGIRYF